MFSSRVELINIFGVTFMYRLKLLDVVDWFYLVFEIREGNVFQQLTS
jgi:hypothetical protein